MVQSELLAEEVRLIDLCCRLKLKLHKELDTEIRDELSFKLNINLARLIESCSYASVRYELIVFLEKKYQQELFHLENSSDYEELEF